MAEVEVQFAHFLQCLFEIVGLEISIEDDVVAELRYLTRRNYT